MSDQSTIEVWHILMAFGFASMLTTAIVTACYARGQDG